MTQALGPTRTFEPGTTGWTAADLDDPRISAQWMKGRHEIIEGVLTKMPPAYFAGGNVVLNISHRLKSHMKASSMEGRLGVEVDIIIDSARVVVADAVLLTPEDQQRQEQAAERESRPDPMRTRLLVPPTLVIESVSPGHESHDRRTKLKWYAEFGVKHYWIADAYQRSLECLRSEGGVYRVDASGGDEQIIEPSLFPGLKLNLTELWTG